jgi:hypothetical protein
MTKPQPEPIELDYEGAPKDKGLLENLSTVVATGDFLWSAADEGRTVECLKRDGGRYRFHRQVDLDDVFPNLPGSSKDEADIESIDIAGGRLWMCDLAHLEDALLVLAGPVGREQGPYRIYRWTPQRTVEVQSLEDPILADWTTSAEKPEGICCVKREGVSGILIVYDSPDGGRIVGSVYTADWFPRPA